MKFDGISELEKVEILKNKAKIQIPMRGEEERNMKKWYLWKKVNNKPLSLIVSLFCTIFV